MCMPSHGLYKLIKYAGLLHIEKAYILAYFAICNCFTISQFKISIKNSLLKLVKIFLIKRD